jgi:hypothetical protein
MLDPSLANLRIDKELPQDAKSATDMDFPHRTVLRTDKVLPSSAAFKMEMFELNVARPRIEKVDPKATYCMRESDPLTLDVYPRTDNEDPSDAQPRMEIRLEICA